jgi:hypothetical protein
MDPSQAPVDSRDALRRELSAGLGKLRISVAACSEVDRGPASPGTAPGWRGPRAGPRGRVVLTLEIETREGELRVVEARLPPGNEAADRRLTCVLDVLRGQVVSAPSAVPGKRMEVPFPVKL